MSSILQRIAAAKSIPANAQEVDSYGRTLAERTANQDPLAPFIEENRRNQVSGRNYPIRHDIPNMRAALSINDPDVNEAMQEVAEFLAKEKGWPKNLAMCVMANACIEMRMLTYTPPA